MWLLFALSLPAHAECSPVVELPAAVASARAWPDRHALAACPDRDEAEQAKAARVGELLVLLEAHQPAIERGPLRGLVEAAGSGDGPWVEQALRAARLSWPLPERTEGQEWHAAVPVPVPEGTPLAVAATDDGPLAEAIASVAAQAGWRVVPAADGPFLTVSAKKPEPARWGKHRGYAVEVSGTVGDHEANVDGFAIGPLAVDTRRSLMETAVAQILADHEVVKALAPDVVAGPNPPTGALERTDASELCILRRPDQAGLPVRLRIGPHHEVSVPTASYGCMELPMDMEIRSPYGRRTLGEEPLIVELSDRGEAPGRFRILDGDPDAIEKLRRKGKLDEWTPGARPATE